LPLSVWLCSDTTPAGADVTDRPRAAEAVCGRHREAMGRELARHLIGVCTRSGGVVADVFTTSGAALVAAAEMGRMGIGCVPRFVHVQGAGVRVI
jgi:DNA modification methylase